VKTAGFRVAKGQGWTLATGSQQAVDCYTSEGWMNLKRDAAVLLGAVVGGLIGHMLFFWVARQGFYGLVLPGGLLGLGAGIGRGGARWIAVVCGVAALALGLFTEWRFAPFAADPGLGYFLTHLHQLRPLTMAMIAVGAAIGFWVPFRRAGVV